MLGQGIGAAQPFSVSLLPIYQLIFGSLVVLSLVIAIISIRNWSRIEFPRRPQSSENLRITVVLPTWNEEKVIESKLDEIISQAYPLELIELIVIDSASQDSTIKIVNDWLVKNDLQDNPRFKIIMEEERLGKSVSINNAFGSADPDSEILMMSDVDCRLEADVLSRISSWFQDPTIGSVTGRQVLLNPEQSSKSSQEVSYRDFFGRIRVAESKLHSTPIFHGECSAYRREAISGHKLVENANADDSQMAVSAIRSGFRSIYDPETIFYEMAPPDGNSSRIQKVRRAQGLVRHFWRNKDMIFSSKFGSFRRVMALEFTLHILTPIFVLLGFICGFAHIFLTLDGVNWVGIDFLEEISLVGKIMLISDLIVLLLLFSGYFEIPVPGGRLSLTFFNYMLLLLHAQILILFGKSLHKWQQVPSVRDALAQHDRMMDN